MLFNLRVKVGLTLLSENLGAPGLKPGAYTCRVVCCPQNKLRSLEEAWTIGGSGQYTKAG